MAVSLGKRKSRHDRHENADRSDREDQAALRARFQKAFEAKFKPLQQDNSGQKREKSMVLRHQKSEVDENVSDDESDWSGLSGDIENDDDGDDDDVDVINDEALPKRATVIEIVEHSALPSHGEDELRRAEAKAFMSSKPPELSTIVTTRKLSISKKSNPSTDETEATNLQHDLALQRLLKESHLLDASNFASTSAGTDSSTPTGKARLRATELRLQDLGAKTSLAADQQRRMPMALRKGIAAKATGREEERRREAKENGIVLERFAGGGVDGRSSRGGAGGVRKRGGVRRERGEVGGPRVGKMRGGLLTLSRRDVRDIEGSRGGGGGRGGSRRGRGRGVGGRR